MSAHYIIDLIKDVHVNNPYNEIKRNYLQAADDGGLMTGVSSSKISSSRKRIVRLSQALNFMSSFMVVYSMIYVAMKLMDISDISSRLSTYQSSKLYREEHDRFQTLYFQVNYVSLLFSVLTFVITVYIKWTLRKTMIFNSLMYQRFIWFTFSIVLLYVGLFVFFLIRFLDLAHLYLPQLIDGLTAITKLMSNSPSRILFEMVLGFFLFFGIYGLIWLSNEIEDEIKRLEMLRGQSNLENSQFVSQMEMC